MQGEALDYSLPPSVVFRSTLFKLEHVMFIFSEVMTDFQHFPPHCTLISLQKKLLYLVPVLFGCSLPEENATLLFYSTYENQIISQSVISHHIKIKISPDHRPLLTSDKHDVW